MIIKLGFGVWGLGMSHDHPHSCEGFKIGGIHHLPNVLRIATSQVVVDSDDVHTLALEGVEVGCERRNERLALASAHLGQLAVVKRHTANQLDVIVAEAEHAE